MFIVSRLAKTPVFHQVKEVNYLRAFLLQAVGEPPLFLAASVFFAIKDAIASARQEVGLKENFRFDSPATAANIRLACADDITAKVSPRRGRGRRKRHGGGTLPALTASTLLVIN